MSERELPKEDRDVHVRWLDDILNLGVNLTTWEQEFVEDLESRFRAGGHLSSRKQEIILERIYAERTP
jgi:hypothetical protein